MMKEERISFFNRKLAIFNLDTHTYTNGLFLLIVLHANLLIN